MSTAAQTRQPGHYWVRFHVDDPDKWQVAKWSEEFAGEDEAWLIIGGDFLYSDDDFAEIDERRIERDAGMPVIREAQE